MKKIGSILFDIVIGIWLIVSIFVTVCLLSYNEFKVTTFGNHSLLIIDSDEMEPDFKEGDLLIVKRNSDNKIEVGDRVFYYNSAVNSKVLIYSDEVQDKEQVNKGETTYFLDGQKVSGEYIIGKLDTTKAYHGLGTLLGVFTSRWGFMFLVIFPTLFAIIYEIMLVVEARRAMKKEEKELKEAKEEKKEAKKEE